MRIIAGSLGGRQFDAPRGHRTHPMSDKARGGLFNILGDIDGLTVLDAFAGSGALGFEALSRGAASVMAIEVDKAAHRTIQESAAKLQFHSRHKAIRASVAGWSNNNELATFDLILADPPYDDLQIKVLQKLTHHVKPGGLLVVSWPAQTSLLALDTVEQIDQKSYGDAQLVFYRKIT